MPSCNSGSPADVFLHLGSGDSPWILDVRTDEDFDADPRILPGALRRDWRDPTGMLAGLDVRRIVVVCQRGAKLSEGVAAFLRSEGRAASVLAGGFVAWRDAGLPLAPATLVPDRHPDGRTVWVTRERPKIDRIACPWLVRRFIDPRARFLFVAASEVLAVAERFDATPFDVEHVRWSHEGALCTFDVMLRDFGLETPALKQLARIVRGADTMQFDLAPEAAGLLALSLGLSRRFPDDLAQLEAALPLYDSLYLWSRDGVGETHTWPPAASA